MVNATAWSVAWGLLACFGWACGALQPTAASVSRTRLLGSDGQSVVVPSPQAGWTVVVFFSADCDCQSAHDARLRELHARYASRGVAFLAVDSEVGATAPRDAALARQRAYPFPLVIDRGAKLARALDAEYATYTVVLDASGHIRYRGGIDSDYRELRADAHFYLHDALEDLLAGRPVAVPYGQTLGCALRLW